MDIESEWSRVRETKPDTGQLLANWFRRFTAARVATTPVCRGHDSPLAWLKHLWQDEPDVSLCHASRGSGKSFLAALHTHARSRFHPGLGTKILGGSLQQSAQVYRAIREGVMESRGVSGLTDAAAIESLLARTARYRNGSAVEILAASSRSVRGPHVPDLKLDEVDEMKPDLIESAFGMAQTDLRRGYKTTVVMTSTWHNAGGVMGKMVERAEAKEFKLFRFCTFEVLERCPPERSGPNLEKCPECPIYRHCWEERFNDPDRPPKAKLSAGHYSIGSLIQKARVLSPAAFRSDFLCRGPKVEGLYFDDFDEAANCPKDVRFLPGLPVYLAVDTGHWTAAVWFQLREMPSREGPDYEVRVLADYLVENKKPESVGQELLRVPYELQFSAPWRVFCDPAGDQRHGTGVVILAEYERVGLKGSQTGRLERWPVVRVKDSVALLQALVLNATGIRRLLIHPRCKSLITAMRHYRKAQRGGQWMDYPEDPQHPHEDLVDALRGGIKSILPEGRKPQPKFATARTSQVF